MYIYALCCCISSLVDFIFNCRTRNVACDMFFKFFEFYFSLPYPANLISLPLWEVFCGTLCW